MIISYLLTNANPDYTLYRSVVADTALIIYISNDLSYIINIWKVDPNDFVLISNTANKIKYQGIFRANYKILDSSNITMKLLEYAYVEGFHINIMLLQKAEKAGIYINSCRKVLEQKDREVFYSFKRYYRFYIVKYNQI